MMQEYSGHGSTAMSVAAGNEVVITAMVAPAEHAALRTAGERLAACIERATGQHWSVDVRFVETPDEIAPAALLIASLLTELQRPDEPPAQVAARWRGLLRARGDDSAPAFICTIFRHVTSVSDRWRNATPPLPIERIRRLNLLAAELSQATGANVIDIDRVFAHAGARALQTDYRLGGTQAAGLAADTIVATLLTAGLGDAVPAEAQDRARDIHAERSAAALGAALAVSARSLRFETSRHDRARQSFAAIGPVLTPPTSRELLRDVRHGRARIGAVAPIILGKLMKRLPWRRQ
jgi:hypothetical protein